jgi:hypothetical protein
MNDNHSARKTFRAAIGSLARDPRTPFTEIHLPPPDVFGHLADRQLLRSDINSICDYVRDNWPKVQRIDCGIDSLGKPHFDVQLDPFEWADIATHRPLADWIRENYPTTADMSIHFFPILDGDRIRTSVTAFDRTPSFRQR